jgi:hypothetical protein
VLVELLSTPHHTSIRLYTYTHDAIAWITIGNGERKSNTQERYRNHIVGVSDHVHAIGLRMLTRRHIDLLCCAVSEYCDGEAVATALSMHQVSKVCPWMARLMTNIATTSNNVDDTQRTISG